MKGQVTEISCRQVHTAGAFFLNFLWDFTVPQFNTKHILSLNRTKNRGAKWFAKQLWCEDKDDS